MHSNILYEYMVLKILSSVVLFESPDAGDLENVKMTGAELASRT
jgi:hypothetical protein